MPAIQLTRLKIQSTRLAELFSQPGNFCLKLDELFDFYADRSHHPAHAGEPPPIIHAYHVPQPVIRHIFTELKPIALHHPPAALEICDHLWQHKNLEFRLLAAAILGVLPADYKVEVLTRINNWISTEAVSKIIDALLDQGLSNLRNQAAEDFFTQVDSWFNSKNLRIQQTGIRALLPLLNDPGFDNLPVVYRLVTPFVRVSPEPIRRDLVEVVRALARRSPPETAFFLHHNLNAPDNPLTAWLIRQVMDEFPPELKEHLREILRESH